MSALLAEIQKILPAPRVLAQLIDRLSYASDAGFYQLVPQVVVQPQTLEEVQQLLAVCKAHQTPAVFRAGGTSLSGQSITDGVLIDIGRHWSQAQVLQEGRLVQVQPGITGAMVNALLKKYGRKIGPDPASINAAMMGGIISNNASGMCCGVANNAYHTLHSIQFVLASGQAYHTAVPADYERFKSEQPHLYQTLLTLRAQLHAQPHLCQRIRHKYQTKNTVGYGLNALLDFEHPLDIFAHLLPGAEGTLAFIAQATLLTLPDLPCKSAAMLYFDSIEAACQAIVPLRHTGVEALELMDRASLRSVAHLEGLPPFFAHLPNGAAALLCEYQTESPGLLRQKLEEAAPVLQSLPLLHPATFTTTEKERLFYWKLRKGMFPSVGAVRARGTTVILEDIAVPVAQLADAVKQLQQLFLQFGYHNAIIFGHAKDGNIHFVITQLLDSPAEIDRYNRFMQAVVALVVQQYDGALKAEHGTGRNMAPFVEAEWGGDLYALMQQIKAAADPDNLLNPGVIINPDKEAHIKNLKDLPQVEPVVDACIECGFCEPSCPSRQVTMTPRRRIVARRALQRLQHSGARQQHSQLLKEYQYQGLDTCATDGLCATDCPVGINTGELVKQLRQEQHGQLANRLSRWAARHFSAVEAMARLGIATAATLNRLPGRPLTRITQTLHRWWPAMPVWISQVHRAPQWPQTRGEAAPQAVYFTACINRIMSSTPAGQPGLQQTLLTLAQRAGVTLIIPPNIKGYCCGQPFSSKGYSEAGIYTLERLVKALLQWSHNGQWPVVCDFTSCTYTLLQQMPHLPANLQQAFKQIQWIDSVQWIQQTILPRLKLQPIAEQVGLHATCAVTKLGLGQALQQTAQACAQRVFTAHSQGCCGMAGDRGFWVPALTQGATAAQAAEMQAAQVQRAYASATTCEIALHQHAALPFSHIAYLVEEASRPLAAG